MNRNLNAARLLAGIFLPFWLSGNEVAGAETPLAPVSVSDLRVTGEIQGENVTFKMAFTAEAKARQARLPLVEGDVAPLALPAAKKVELERDGKLLRLMFGRRGKQAIEFEFASLPAREGEWRATRFTIPAANVRQLTLVCDREDLEVDFPGALGIERRKDSAGRMTVQAFLGTAREFSVRWKPEVKQLAGELAVTCDANVIASAGVGALRLDALYTFRVVQGSLSRVALAVPADLNVTQVRGADIREWALEATTGGARRLVVNLNRPQENTYQLAVEGERVLPAFPCKFELPALSPEGVIRTSGFVMLGTDSAVVLTVNKSAGLTQVDYASFPSARLTNQPVRLTPARGAFAYQYAGMPYQLELAADDIVTTLHSEERLTLSLSDNDLTLNAAVELDVRDAPAREVAVLADPDWVVANVAGANIADYDVQGQGTSRLIRIFFREAVLGRALFDLRFEKTLPEGQTTFAVPRFQIPEARSERGFIVLSAEKGVRLKPEPSPDLREVHTGSLPVRVADAQHAFRFKGPDWRLSAGMEKTAPSIHAEIFQLVTIGDAALYGSVSVTYHIGSAPVRSLKLAIPAASQNVEFTGRDIRGWEKTGQLWQVSFQEKILGDYTLLVTYDQPFRYEGGDLLVGGIETVGTESEVGYLVLAGAAGMNFEQTLRIEPAVLEIDRAEIPPAYALLINDPVLRAYKYIGSPHGVALKGKRYASRALLGQVADHTTLATRISKEGEAVTTAAYYIKNASQQYLGLVLPRAARLWSVAVDGEEAQALDLKDKNSSLLIPLPRRRDPNQAFRVEAVYAESLPRLGFLRRLELRAPQVDAQAVFAKWSVTLPEQYAVARTSGNMMPADEAPVTGMMRLGSAWWQFWRTLATDDLGWLLCGAILLAVAARLVYNAARGRLFAWSNLLLLLAVLLVGALALRGSDGVDALERLSRSPLFQASGATWSFVRPVSLAGSEPLVVLRVLPAWIGAGGSVFWALVGIGGGLLLLGFAIRSSERKACWIAGSLTLLTVGLASLTATRPIVFAVSIVGVPLALAAGVVLSAWRAGRRRAAAVPAEEPAPTAAAPEPAGGSRAGGATTAALTLLLTGAACGAAWAGAVTNQVAGDATPVMRQIEFRVRGPGLAKNEPKVASVTAMMEFRAERPGACRILAPPNVLTNFDLSSADLSLAAGADGYRLAIADDGDYRVRLDFLAPVSEKDGQWSLTLPLLPNLRNTAAVRLPATGLDVQCADAVLLKAVETNNATEIAVVFGPAASPALTWRPRERRTRLEKTAFFCEANTLASFEPGVVSMRHAVRYQIAQGELQSLGLAIPAGMSVTAVSAPGLSTWRFDPESRVLEALLAKPVSADFTLYVTTQIPQESLPYTAVCAVPAVADAVRQRGAVALMAPDSIQIQVNAVTGVNAMAVGDFPLDASLAEKLGRGAAIKRAFRYQQLPVAVTARADPVLPELRAVEDARLDISDERIVLSSKIELAISRSGVFAVTFRLPSEYEVESLGGQDVSHWDEIKEGGRGVRVYFDKQILGERTLNLVLARTEKGIETEIAVPRLIVEDAVKHTGSLVVTGERGVRLTTARRDGVSEINPGELGLTQPGALAFKLLRPDWSLALKTEVMAPVIRAEVLQQVRLTEGLLLGRCTLNFKIDNAGVKVFTLRAPQTNLALAITGRNIARVQPVDRSQGLWQVELHNKVEKDYLMQVNYQAPREPQATAVTVAPLLAVGAESQKGYLVVMSSPRLRVIARGMPAGCKAEDARNIPLEFKAGDLSDAVLCYRTTHPEYALDLDVVRHGSAEILPATVQRVRLQSVVADDDHMVTRVTVDLRAGELRFLKTTLPPGSEVWSAFVNGRSATPLLEGAASLIPLDQAGAGGRTTVEFIYGGKAAAGAATRAHRCAGPQFDLPLTDIEWTFYVPPARRYFGFGGTVSYRSDRGQRAVFLFDDQKYLADNAGEAERNYQKAASILKQGEQYVKEGRQRDARKAFESALYYSQGKADFNEDVRVQYRNLARQQAVVGLVNRRGALRSAQNVQQPDDGRQQRQLEQTVEGGEWSADYAQQVAQSLSVEDNDALNVVAEKILDQQEAAAGLAPPIRITVPLQGRRLQFVRLLQIKPNAELSVSYRAVSDRALQWLAVAGSVVLMALVYRLLAGLIVRRR